VPLVGMSLYKTVTVGPWVADKEERAGNVIRAACHAVHTVRGAGIQLERKVNWMWGHC
jgi:hypothetical protein